jgi:hypothetical protein
MKILITTITLISLISITNCGQDKGTEQATAVENPEQKAPQAPSDDDSQPTTKETKTSETQTESTDTTIQTAENSSQPQDEGVTKAGQEKVVACSFDIDGEKFEGNTEEECEQLKADLGLDQSPTQPDEGATSSDYVCQFNINGEVYDGNSKEECDQLKEDLGINF